MKIRLQKFLSNAGLASRREAEEWIIKKHVKVNGKLATIGESVDPDIDEVTAFGKIVTKPESLIYIAMNKPKGFVVSKRDPFGRKNVFRILDPELMEKVWNVGRLDFATEGLLLFTNDGELTQQLTHPSFEHEKEYEVTTDQLPTDTQIEGLRDEADKVKVKGNILSITIHEGKKHQIRRMLDRVKLPVVNLKRIRIEKYKLGNIKPGEYITISKEEIL